MAPAVAPELLVLMSVAPELSFFMAQAPTPLSVCFHTSILAIVLVGLKLNKK